MIDMMIAVREMEDNDGWATMSDLKDRLERCLKVRNLVETKIANKTKAWRGGEKSPEKLEDKRNFSKEDKGIYL